jgi:uncharacterized DUF497 family protein
MIFSWDDWNTDHIAEHGVDEAEAEYVVKHARPPFPREIGHEKYLVWGRTAEGRHLQVVFVYRSPGDVDYESIGLPGLLELAEETPVVVYVVHAMEMTARMKKQYRRL